MKKLILVWGLMAGCALGAQSESDILKGVDQRIQKYRTGQANLRLVGPKGKPIAAGAKITIEQTRHAFLFGCNIFQLGKLKTPADSASYAGQFAELLNFATLPFYWWYYVPQQGKPRDQRTEEILAWCRQNNITTKGHPLAWNFGDPPWLKEYPNQIMDFQIKRIERCVRNFDSGIKIWDVVNEATHWDRKTCWERAPILTQAIKRIGVQEYVRTAFQAARKANPDAALIINDYRTDTEYEEKIIKQLVDETGKPFYDIIGIQSHQHSGAWPVEKTWEVCERYAKYGKPLHFTEVTFLSGKLGFTVKDKNPDFDWVSTPEGERRQARDAARFYIILFSHPAVEAITWWDLTDQRAWKSAPAGLLRRDLSPKPAYLALKKLIKDKWWTRTEAAVAKNGQTAFRGFFGQYKVTLIEGGKKMTGNFSFDKKTKGPTKVNLK